MKALFKFLLIMLVLSVIGTQCDDCPDPTNPECDDYNPCHPLPCNTLLEGTVVVDNVLSPGLEHNILGDEANRKLSVYLPAGYETETSKEYPVIYLLHGYLCDYFIWYGGDAKAFGGYPDMNLDEMMDTLIDMEYILPMIVVSPSTYNRYEGSWYTNSSVSGSWEDFIFQDVVSYIDNHYRTIPAPESRGIAGHSMGGYGAMKLAMKHPEVFGSVYAMSASDLVFEDSFLDLKKEDMIEALQEESYSIFTDFRVRAIISRSAAYAPNPLSHPFPGDIPMDENGNIVDSTWQKWLKHDPYSMLDGLKENLMQLQAIQFDCGNSDNSCFISKHFSEALSDLGIEHEFETYSGDHLNKISLRMAGELFPFFSEH
ncbi:MAG: hypothetical protein KAT15_32190, partial [Bacteroidales bacterium]|nr:hypothetical protein [Bacteroidales bacterium]